MIFKVASYFNCLVVMLIRAINNSIEKCDINLKFCRDNIMCKSNSVSLMNVKAWSYCKANSSLNVLFHPYMRIFRSTIVLSTLITWFKYINTTYINIYIYIYIYIYISYNYKWKICIYDSPFHLAMTQSLWP